MNKVVVISFDDLVKLNSHESFLESVEKSLARGLLILLPGQGIESPQADVLTFERFFAHKLS